MSLLARAGRAVPGLATALALISCSSGEQQAVAPASADEQRALAEARAMIPPDELPSPGTTATGEPAGQEGEKP